MGLLEKIATRRNYPLTLAEGNTIQLCALTIDEIERITAIPAELRNAFMLGSCLCEDDGRRAFEKQAEETDAAFAGRVNTTLKTAGVRTDTLIEITRAAGTLGAVDRDTIAKN